jgi:hypothetical protein
MIRPLYDNQVSKSYCIHWEKGILNISSVSKLDWKNLNARKNQAGINLCKVHQGGPQ